MQAAVKSSTKSSSMPSSEASSWLEIGNIEEIPKLGARVVKYSQGDIAIFRTADDRIFALRDQCPHKQGPLSQGIVHDHTVTCPLHNWKIKLEDGQAVAPDEGCAGVYQTKIEGGIIFLAI